MNEQTIKIKMLLFFTLLSKKIYKKLDKLYVAEWDKLRIKVCKKINNESPLLIKDSRQAYREPDIHTGWRR